MRTTTFLLFYGILTTLTVAVHYYLYRRLLKDPAWPERVRRGGAIAFAVLGSALLFGVGSTRFVPRAVAGPLSSVAFVWMGAIMYLGLLVISADLIRLAVKSAERVTGRDFVPERRALLARGATVTAGVVTVGATGVALRGGLADVERREVEVKLARLPPQLAGLKIVQVSDIHVGPLIGERFMSTIVERVNREKPDLVVITGDLVDGSVAELGAHVAPIGRFQSRYGSYFVTGNHEYYSGVESWLAELERIGIRTLRNERVSIGDAASIDLGGIDDYRAKGFAPGHGSDVSRIVAGRDPERELVLLAHQPRSIDEAVKAGAGLQISGHTHGGQLWPATEFVRLTTPYVAGLYRHDENTQIYVSRGTGFWGPPMRLAAPAEITVVHLV